LRAQRAAEINRDATPHGGDVVGLLRRHRPR
jgi:hypothetical protein